MIRDKSIEEIFDGKFYGINDLAKIDCNGCKGCSVCCHSMGASVILDPLDAHRLSVGLKTDVSILLQEHMELNVVDGLILPNLRLNGEDEACTFLNGEGRCSVHEFRPGVCRLFPLGRYYDGKGDFTYIVQAGECPYPVKSKIKIKKWIDTPDYGAYHKFVLTWHDLLKRMQKKANEADPAQARNICIQLLQAFYLTPYPETEFYGEFYRRVDNISKEMY